MLLAGAAVLGDDTAFLGHDLIVWFLLALGAALVVGNVAALLRPPPKQKRGADLERPPVGRSLVMVGLGAVAAIWALATLLHA